MIERLWCDGAVQVVQSKPVRARAVKFVKWLAGVFGMHSPTQIALPPVSSAIQEQLGVVLDATAQSGGFGSVYTGRKTDGSRVAVKVQPATSASAAAEEHRLHRLAAAPHDNLVALLQPPLVADGYHHLVITLCDRDLVDLLTLTAERHRW